MMPCPVGSSDEANVSGSTIIILSELDLLLTLSSVLSYSC